MRARAVGEAAVLIDCADLTEMRAVHAEALRRSPGLNVQEIVPAARSVLLDGVSDVTGLIADVATWSPRTVHDEEGPLVTLPVTYDGPDLEEVAALWGVDVAEVATIHRGIEHVVAFCGFAPGFAYCSGLPEDRAVPRRREPRSRVPAGSVGLAGSLTGLYPRESPGGWQLIGRTTTPLWRPEEDPPALLRPGTRIRFRDADA